MATLYSNLAVQEKTIRCVPPTSKATDDLLQDRISNLHRATRRRAQLRVTPHITLQSFVLRMHMRVAQRALQLLDGLPACAAAHLDLRFVLIPARLLALAWRMLATATKILVTCAIRLPAAAVSAAAVNVGSPVSANSLSTAEAKPAAIPIGSTVVGTTTCSEAICDSAARAVSAAGIGGAIGRFFPLCSMLSAVATRASIEPSAAAALMPSIARSVAASASAAAAALTQLRYLSGLRALDDALPPPPDPRPS
eukprot:CAMPEP_0115846798 /NCGR_PEP_ID=MMETSP0287-20121206/10047_1 /TAXON_ID=412157 /ORGANISM="Chrysochromulina rotalis, Strain UIO044" /LENGTH=252 /DNA_ID=CAMNT_0003300601 /DNA_START=114 /DNA_END=873 /DNA_ORIENTATION=-